MSTHILIRMSVAYSKIETIVVMCDCDEGVVVLVKLATFTCDTIHAGSPHEARVSVGVIIFPKHMSKSMIQDRSSARPSCRDGVVNRRVNRAVLVKLPIFMVTAKRGPLACPERHVGYAFHVRSDTSQVHVSM